MTLTRGGWHPPYATTGYRTMSLTHASTHAFGCAIGEILLKSMHRAVSGDAAQS
jgi:hypothetical protein